MHDYKTRFLSMIEALRRDPAVRIHNLWIGAPASDEDFAYVEGKLGYGLSEDIKTFFRQMNGLQLCWSTSGDASSTRTTEDKALVANQSADGLINILPLRRLFVDENYEDRIQMDFMQGTAETFAGVEFDLYALMSTIRPFDDFSGYASMALVLALGEGNPPAVLGSDHNASFTDSRITDFASYMEFVLRERGLVAARRARFNEYAGHRQRPLVGPQLEEAPRWWRTPEPAAPPAIAADEAFAIRPLDELLDSAGEFVAEALRLTPAKQLEVPTHGELYYEAETELTGAEIDAARLAELIGRPVFIRREDQARVVGSLLAVDGDMLRVYSEMESAMSVHGFSLDSVEAIGLARLKEELTAS